ncbi:MAG: OmpA family protein [Saprospiraceae bacterium]|nr:OmpA family protein [Saprospiraceae bacterium]
MKTILQAFLLLLAFDLSAQAPAVLDSSAVVFAAQVHFDFGRHELRPEADSALTQVVEQFGGKGNHFIRITAHTDSVGSQAANLELSQRRATSVAAYLTGHGVLAEQIEAIEKYGESRPAASNRTDEGRQLNRRATVEVRRRLPMTWMEGRVVDQETGEGIDAQVVVRSKESSDSTRTDSIGRFRARVPDQTVIGLDVFAEGYFFETQMLKSNALKPIELKVELPRAVAGKTVALKNFYFVGNMAVLLERSEPELPKLLKFMQLNPKIKIEIAGHINLPNSPLVKEDTWHYRLSVNRAKMVYDYLVEQGVQPERIEYKGYGNWEMRFPFAVNEREQELNRRVEIKVLGTDSVISRPEPLPAEGG